MTLASVSYAAPPLARNARPITIDGRPFEIILSEETSRSWHWIITAPGELALSGEAASEIQALASACRAGRALARRGVV